MDIDITSEDERILFERLWKNNFSFIPPMDTMSQALREKLKEFTLKVFMYRSNKKDMQVIAEEAYENGFEDGKIKAMDIVNERFPDFINALKDII